MNECLIIKIIINIVNRKKTNQPKNLPIILSEEKKITISKATNTQYGIRMDRKSEDDFRGTIRMLQEKLFFHTYISKGVVIKGVREYMTKEEIKKGKENNSRVK